MQVDGGESLSGEVSNPNCANKAPKAWKAAKECSGASAPPKSSVVVPFFAVKNTEKWLSSRVTSPLLIREG